MSDSFNNESFKPRTTAVPAPPFTIRSAGENGDAINDWYDLDELFQDDFFPKEVDFTDLFTFDDDQSREPGNNMVPVFSSLGHEGIDITPKDKTKVIMIPPMMPRTSFPFDTATPASGSSSAAGGRTKEAAAVTEPPRRKVTVKGVKVRAGDKREMDLDDFEDGDLTEDQRIERRDRNREHAKRSRIRKRVLLDTLQDQLAALRAQNVRLRRVVADRLPGELAARVLLKCTTEESTLLGDGDLVSVSSAGSSGDDRGGGGGGGGGGKGNFKPSALTSSIAAGVVQQQRSNASAKGKSSGGDDAGGSSSVGSKKVLMEPDYRLISSLITSQQNFVLSDPSLPDNPIVYASDGFCRLSGYRRQDVLGRNCRFLQGPGTDQAALNVIRQGLAEGRDISVCLLNYRADGSPFWNQFFLGALKDAQGQVVNYVGVQCEVNVLPIAEIKDRVKKLPLPDA